MQEKTPFNHCINRRKALDVISSPFPQRGSSTNVTAPAFHARGTASMRRISKFSEEPENEKKKYEKLFC